jgi:aspartate racemase
VKTIGMIGGMSWQSTVPYYQLANRLVAERLGGFHSAKLLLSNVDFAEVEPLMREGWWNEAGQLLAEIAVRLEQAGAELLILCTNTLHKVAPAIEARLRIPFLHIVDATAREIRRAAVRRAGLIATRFTMEEAFYRERLSSQGIETLIPPEAERIAAHRIIFEELVHGRIVESSQRTMRSIAGQLVQGGAEGIILGCTELAVILGPEDVSVPLFDTTTIHAREAVERALDG